MQRVGVGFAKAMKLCALDAGFLCNRFELAQKVAVGFSFPVWKD